MPKATYNGVTLAESSDVKLHNSNVYFPAEAVNMQHVVPGDANSTDPRFGTVHFFDVVVNGQTIKHAAWHYTGPTAETEDLKGRIAFMPVIDVLR